VRLGAAVLVDVAGSDTIGGVLSQRRQHAVAIAIGVISGVLIDSIWAAVTVGVAAWVILYYVAIERH